MELPHIVQHHHASASLNTTLGKAAAAAASTTTATDSNSSQTDSALNPVGDPDVTTDAESAHHKSEDGAKSENQAEAELQTHDNEIKTYESNYESHGKRNDKDKPASKDVQTASEIDDSAASEGFFKKTVETVKKTVGRAGRAIKSGVEAVGAFGSNIMDMGRGQMRLVYEKKTSIDLPHGKGPKTYCRWISYKPINCKLTPDLVITLTIIPSGRCHHEDTHLFVRFAGYNYVPPSNSSSLRHPV